MKKVYRFNVILILCLTTILLFLCSQYPAYAENGRAKWTKDGEVLHATIKEKSKPLSGQSLLPLYKTKTKPFLSFDATFDTPDAVPEKQYHRLKMKGLNLWHGKAGSPILPFKTKKILIPYGQEVTDVKVLLGAKREVPGEYFIEPAQMPVPLSKMDEAEFTPPDPEIYDSDNIYPSIPCGDVFLQKKGGYTILILNLHPVDYQPKSRKLSYYPKMKIDIETSAKEKPAAATAVLGEEDLGVDAKIRDEISSLVDNPKALQSYDEGAGQGIALSGSDVEPLGDADEYEYIIITTNALRDANGEYKFQDLVASKQAKGLIAKIVTVEDDIYPTYDGTTPKGTTDNQTKIRNFIIDYYQNHKTRYVLLAGTNALMPARLFYVNALPDYNISSYIQNIPSDLYYACLDGTFDNDADGKYGEPNDGPNEGEVDLYAEVAVGRAAVENAVEVSNFVRKTLTYDTSASDYRYKMYSVGEFLGFGKESNFAKSSIEQIRLGSSEDGYTTIGFENSIYADLFDTPTLYDADRYLPPDYSTTGWDKSELIAIMNSDTPQVFNHLGHGNVTYDMKLNTSDLTQLTNSDYFFIYTQACLPGKFDSANCFAEVITTMSRGAFAVCMNANYGWGTRYSTDGPSERFHREFWDAYFYEGFTQFSRMNQDSKEDLIQRIGEDCMRWITYELNYFGDPELRFNIENDITAQIKGPSPSAYIKGSINIEGSAYAPENFDRYELYYAPADNPENAILIYSSTAAVQNGILTDVNAPWDTTQIQDGEYILILKVFTIDGKEYKCLLHITVDNYNNPPRFKGLSNKYAVIDEADQYQKLIFIVSAEDVDDPKSNWGRLEFSASNLPPGATFDRTGRKFTWKPRMTQKGTYEVTFTVSDKNAEGVTDNTVTEKILVSTVYPENALIGSGRYTSDFSIYNDKIAYAFAQNQVNYIYVWDLKKGREKLISADSRSNVGPVMYEDTLVWAKGGDIWTLDLTTNEEKRITNDDTTQTAPDIYGDTITWLTITDLGGGRWHTYEYHNYMYSISQNILTELPEYGKNLENAKVYGSNIVWTEETEGGDFFANREAFVYDTSTGESRQITFDPNPQQSLEIYGNKVVWSEYEQESSRSSRDFMVFIYDLETRQTDPVLWYGGDMKEPDIFKDRVAWAYDMFTSELYVSDLEFGIVINIFGYADYWASLCIYGDTIIFPNSSTAGQGLSIATLRYSPQLYSVSAQTAATGDRVVLTGKNFGYCEKDTQVVLGSATVLPIEAYSNDEIVCRIPNGAQSGLLKVVNPGGQSNKLTLNVTDSGVNTYTLNITAENGTVTVAPQKALYQYGETVTLTAVSHIGSLFAGWSGDITSADNPITVTMDSNKAITANFALNNSYTLQINTTGNGHVTIEPQKETYQFGDLVTLTAVPDEGYALRSWSGDINDRVSPMTIMIRSNMSITANFEWAYHLNMTIEGSGYVFLNPNRAVYFYGENVSLTAQPQTGYHFNGWSGDINSTDNPITVTIDSDKNITATFEINKYKITATAGPHGRIEPGGEIILPYGVTQTFYMIPDDDYHVLNVMVDTWNLGVVEVYSFYVNLDRTIHVEFAINSYTLKVPTQKNGTVVVSPVKTAYNPGDQVTITATSNVGYIFAGWSGDLLGTTNPVTITMDSNKVIHAMFKPPEPVLIYTCDDLNNIRNDLSSDYILMNDLDFATADASYTTGAGFMPIGTQTSPFLGRFDGKNYTIKGLFINRASQDYTGLFGYISSASEIKDLKLENVNVVGQTLVGALTGASDGKIERCSSSGKVTGKQTTGGLAGLLNSNTTRSFSYKASLTDSFSLAEVKGSSSSGIIGGLVGENRGAIMTCYAAGSVTAAASNIGGLAGVNNISGQIANSYALGAVTGTGSNYIGGLIGRDEGGRGALPGFEDLGLVGCYAKGNVTGSYIVGGLIGYKAYTGTKYGMEAYGLSSCYATGNVTGSYYVGGLIGQNSLKGKNVEDSYATGNVTASNYSAGGFIGVNSEGIGIVKNCFSTGGVTGSATSALGGFIGANANRPVINCYYNHHDGNPQTAIGASSGGATIECTAIEDDEPYFYGVDNEPLLSWNYNLWSRENDDVDFPILKWQETPPSIVYGDVDGIPGITAQDALVTLKHAAAIEFLPGDLLEAADVDDTDNTTTVEDITAQDALLILMYSAGIIDRFPVEEGQ